MRKKVIVFCEGKILHRESSARSSIDDLLHSYEVMAIVDKQTRGRVFLTKEKNIEVYESIAHALKSLQKIDTDLFLLLGFNLNDELLLLEKPDKESAMIKLKTLEPAIKDIKTIGSHIQDKDSNNPMDYDGHQRN